MANGPRRIREWSSTRVQDESLVAGGSNFRFADAGFSSDDRKGCTIVRLVGSIWYGATAQNADARLALGIAILNDDIGASNLPDPGTDSMDADWMYCVPEMWYRYQTPTQQFGNFTFDIRSMRKYGAVGERLYVITKNKDGSALLNVEGYVRVLCLKP